MGPVRTLLAVVSLGMMAVVPAAGSVVFSGNESDWNASEPGRISGEFSAFFGSTNVSGFQAGLGEQGGSDGWGNPIYVAESSVEITLPHDGATGLSGEIEQVGGYRVVGPMEEEMFSLEVILRSGLIAREDVANSPGERTFFGFTSQDDPIVSFRIVESVAPEPGMALPVVLGAACIGLSALRKIENA